MLREPALETGDTTQASPPASARAQGSVPATVAVALFVLLLALTATSQGGFAIARWAPLELFTLAVLLGLVLAPGRIAGLTRATKCALAGIWGLAAVSMLSMLWAQSSGAAFVAGDRATLYAAAATIPFVLPLSRRALAAAGWAVVMWIAVLAIDVLVRMLVHGAPLFLAGRLNGPVDYRNATACLFALPVWPAVVTAAARRYRRGVRAAALALATLCLGLIFLTESRGILIGLAAGAVVVLGWGPDRVRRAWVAALSFAVIAAISRWLLRPFHAFDGGQGFVTSHEIAVAGTALAIGTAGAFVLGLLIALFDNGLRPNSPQLRHLRQAARVALTLGIIVAVVGGLFAVGNPATYVSGKWDQFRSLRSTTPESTRLLTTSGQRYDIWRVALDEFKSHPVLGVGADNFSFDYYRERATNRNLTDPHGIIFALLSEGGIVALGLFVLFLGGIAAVLRSGWHPLWKRQRLPVSAAAAAGAVWLGESLVDWMWLIPGLTAIAIFSFSVAGAQVLAARRERRGAGATEPSSPPRRARVSGLLRIPGAVVLLAAIVASLALLLSNAYIEHARAMIHRPSAELAAARAAARWDPWSVTAHYLQASALESLGHRPAAYAQLRSALSLEPANSAALGVLGDFEARAGDFAAARTYYRRASALNPLDSGLAQLARIGEPGGAPPRR